jgi:DNA-binding PadR family transcriptional regulator
MPSPQPRGLTTVMIHLLLSLTDGVRHGYAMKVEVEQRTEGRLRLGPATLYESIQRLERDGFINETSQPIETPDPRPQRRYYRLTDEGWATLRTEIARLEELVNFARSRPPLKGESA